MLLWPTNGHKSCLSDFLKRIFLRDVRIYPTEEDYTATTSRGSTKIKNNYSETVWHFFLGVALNPSIILRAKKHKAGDGRQRLCSASSQRGPARLTYGGPANEMEPPAATDEGRETTAWPKRNRYSLSSEESSNK